MHVCLVRVAAATATLAVLAGCQGGRRTPPITTDGFIVARPAVTETTYYAQDIELARDGRSLYCFSLGRWKVYDVKRDADVAAVASEGWAYHSELLYDSEEQPTVIGCDAGAQGLFARRDEQGRIIWAVPAGHREERPIWWAVTADATGDGRDEVYVVVGTALARLDSEGVAAWRRELPGPASRGGRHVDAPRGPYASSPGVFVAHDGPDRGQQHLNIWLVDADGTTQAETSIAGGGPTRSFAAVSWPDVPHGVLFVSSRPGEVLVSDFTGRTLVAHDCPPLPRSGTAGWGIRDFAATSFRVGGRPHLAVLAATRRTSGTALLVILDHDLRVVHEEFLGWSVGLCAVAASDDTDVLYVGDGLRIRRYEFAAPDTPGAADEVADGGES